MSSKYTPFILKWSRFNQINSLQFLFVKFQDYLSLKVLSRWLSFFNDNSCLRRIVDLLLKSFSVNSILSKNSINSLPPISKFHLGWKKSLSSVRILFLDSMHELIWILFMVSKKIVCNLQQTPAASCTNANNYNLYKLWTSTGTMNIHLFQLFLCAMSTERNRYMC